MWDEWDCSCKKLTMWLLIAVGCHSSLEKWEVSVNRFMQLHFMTWNAVEFSSITSELICLAVIPGF